MNKELIVSSNRHETMAAILEDDQVAEIHIEREHQRGVAGNIYKGRVNKVLPGMQSAFVDIGLERDAFLYVSDVVDTIEEFERLESGDGDDSPADGGEANGDAARPRGNGRSRSPRSAQRPTQQIEDLLKAGQEILVQVVTATTRPRTAARPTATPHARAATAGAGRPAPRRGRRSRSRIC